MPNVQEIFDLAVQIGIDNDPRGQERVQEYLKEQQEKYKEMPEKEKLFFDNSLLTNPYADSAIHYLGDNPQVKKMMMGIDIGGAELLLVDQYNKNNPNSKIDLVITHHPTGKALLDLSKTMEMMKELDEIHGVPINQGEKLLDPRRGVVKRNIFPDNVRKVTDIAKMLDIPFMNIHTIGDNCCQTFLQKAVDNKADNIKKLKDIIDVLMEVPEYVESRKLGVSPEIWAGSKESLAGKVALIGFTGGTSGSEKIYEQYARSGIGTIMGMHIKESDLKLVKENNLNMINTTHIASDSLGMNIVLDEVEKQGVEIMSLSGFIRVSRSK